MQGKYVTQYLAHTKNTEMSAPLFPHISSFGGDSWADVEQSLALGTTSWRGWRGARQGSGPASAMRGPAASFVQFSSVVHTQLSA